MTTEYLKCHSEFSSESSILGLMNEFYLIIVSAFVGSLAGFIANIGMEYWRQKYEIRKTVQEKLHYDRALLIADIYEKIIYLEQQVGVAGRSSDEKEVYKLLESLEECFNLFKRSEIYFDLDMRSKIENFSLITLDASVKLLERDSVFKEELTELLSSLKNEIRDRFSKILGVK